MAEGERRIKEPCFCIELFVFLKRMGLEIEPILCVFILKDGTKNRANFCVCFYTNYWCAVLPNDDEQMTRFEHIQCSSWLHVYHSALMPRRLDHDQEQKYS